MVLGAQSTVFSSFPDTVATPCPNPSYFPVVLRVVGAWPWAAKSWMRGTEGALQTFLSHFGKLPQDPGLDGEGGLQ